MAPLKMLVILNKTFTYPILILTSFSAYLMLILQVTLNSRYVAPRRGFPVSLQLTLTKGQVC